MDGILLIPMSSYEIHLQVKTRNGASPIDKTRIYLSYAKNDKDLMLEKEIIF